MTSPAREIRRDSACRRGTPEKRRRRDSAQELAQRREVDARIEDGFERKVGVDIGRWRLWGVCLAKDALHAMLGALEDAFLIRSVALATSSERRRNSNPRKVYPADTALIVAFDRSGRANVGHALETAVLHELDRRKAEVGYVRTASGAEVDFHVRYYDGREELIQVCADLASQDTFARELRALEESKKEHPRAQRRLLSLTLDQMPRSRPRGIEMQAADEWLLDAGD